LERTTVSVRIVVPTSNVRRHLECVAKTVEYVILNKYVGLKSNMHELFNCVVGDRSQYGL